MADESVYQISHWNDLYKEKKADWHFDELHPNLSHIDEIEEGRKCLRVFIPLCGKSYSLLWFADRGHHVVGVESSVIAVTEFFAENNLPFDANSEGNVFRCRNRSIKFVLGDLFSLKTVDEVGPVDVIWDRGSLSAIDPAKRPDYFRLMKSLMNPGCVYAVNVVDYDSSLMAGPPHVLPPTELEESTSDVGHLIRLGETTIVTDAFKDMGVTSLREILFKCKKL